MMDPETFEALPPMNWIGDPSVLSERLNAIFCSQKCPAELILKGYDLARIFRDIPINVVGGFHSAIERDLLPIFLNGKGRIVLGIARYLPNYKIPSEFQGPIKEGRLLLISPYYRPNENRITNATVAARNALIVQIAARVVFIYAHPGGRMEKLCKESLAMGKAVFAIESEWNRGLFEMGVDPHPNPSPNQNWERGVQV